MKEELMEKMNRKKILNRKETTIPFEVRPTCRESE